VPMTVRAARMSLTETSVTGSEEGN
jgi:hypothetical protein